jgi:hypothetical protein
MPIRLNLLAETQAQEESRRRDPVKRAIWVGAFLVFCMLLWSSTIQVAAMTAKGHLHRWQTEISAKSNSFKVALDNQKLLDDQLEKLRALRHLATNRFLNGTVLNALQQSTLDDVQLVRLRVSQNYELTEPPKAKSGSRTRALLNAAKVTERIVLSMDARDTSATQGDLINRYKQTLGENPYFQSVLGKSNEVRLTNFSPPQTGSDNKPFVLFTLECRYPEKTR